MSDKLLDHTLKSLAYFLANNVSGMSSCFVVNPNFDLDRDPHPSNPNQTVVRALPFMTVKCISDSRRPFSMSANILYDVQIAASVGVYAANSEDTMNYTGSMSQALISATHPTTGEVGIQLLNIGSGLIYPDAGCMKIELGQSVMFNAELDEYSTNAKFSSQTPVILSGFKDKTAVLLENMGNIDLDDTYI